jgi:hypothetical protein
MLTAGALESEAFPYDAEVWRIVECQSLIATVRVTDTLTEQQRLEQLLDQTKPAWPEGCVGKDFLLATPFRYWPYPSGSRFRRARQPEGAYYASENVQTAMAELAFLHALFFSESAPEVREQQSPVEMTAFSTRIVTSRAIDLTRPPLDADSASWQHPTDYSHCQDLADTARQSGIEMIRYRSVRDPANTNGINVAALEIAALPDQAPRQRQTWHLFMRETVAQAWCECPGIRLQFAYADWAKIDHRISGG